VPQQLTAGVTATRTGPVLFPLLILQVYDAKKGTFTELGMLDVQQIFGRAGRPQFDTSGEAHIITTHSKLAHYLGEVADY
jgi:superfamily II helicase